MNYEAELDGVKWQLRGDQLEPKVRAVLDGFLHDPDRIARDCQMQVQAVRDEHTAIPKQLTKAERTLVQLAAKREKVLTGWRKGIIEEADMLTQLAHIKKEQAETQAERDQALQSQAHATETITAEWIAAAVTGSPAIADQLQHMTRPVAEQHPLAAFMEKACGPVGFEGDPAELIGAPGFAIDIDTATGDVSVGAGLETDYAAV